MANIKCPKCGSYNTGTAYLNYAAKGLRVVTKFGASLLLGAISGQAHGVHAAHSLMEEEEKRKVLGNKCYHCGHEW